MSKKILKVEGMSCNHCVMAVKNSLRSVESVESVEVDLSSGTAEVLLNTDIDDDLLKKAVQDAGYMVAE